MILRVPGEAVLLRAAPMERHDFRDETYRRLSLIRKWFWERPSHFLEIEV
jgi:hypothetical protein